MQEREIHVYLCVCVDFRVGMGGKSDEKSGMARCAIPGIRFGIFLCESQIVRIVLQAGH